MVSGPGLDVNFVPEKSFEAQEPSIPLIGHSKGVTFILIGQDTSIHVLSRRIKRGWEKESHDSFFFFSPLRKISEIPTRNIRLCSSEQNLVTWTHLPGELGNLVFSLHFHVLNYNVEISLLKKGKIMKDHGYSLLQRLIYVRMCICGFLIGILFGLGHPDN